MSICDSHSVQERETASWSAWVACLPRPRLTDQGCIVGPQGKKASPSSFLERGHSKEFFAGADVVLNPLHFPLPWTCRRFSLNNGLSRPYSLYLDSFKRGMMFIDCSSWKSSLQAYGMRREDT